MRINLQLKNVLILTGIALVSLLNAQYPSPKSICQISESPVNGDHVLAPGAVVSVSSDEFFLEHGVLNPWIVEGVEGLLAKGSESIEVDFDGAGDQFGFSGQINEKSGQNEYGLDTSNKKMNLIPGLRLMLTY